MKTIYKLFFASLLGALLGSFVTLYYGNQRSALVATSIVSIPAASETPISDLWEKISSRLSPSSVGIQVYGANRLARQGSGLIVSSDGLIAAPADLLVSDGIYQIFYDDKIYKGVIVSKSYKLNLLLLKTEALYSSVAELDVSYDYQSGQEILMLGKIFDLSKPVIISQRGLVSYVTERNIIIDATPNSYLLGTGIADSDGKFIGMSYLRSGKINLIRADVIDSFFRDYLSKNNK